LGKESMKTKGITSSRKRDFSTGFDCWRLCYDVTLVHCRRRSFTESTGLGKQRRKQGSSSEILTIYSCRGSGSKNDEEKKQRGKNAASRTSSVMIIRNRSKGGELLTREGGEKTNRPRERRRRGCRFVILQTINCFKGKGTRERKSGNRRER